MFSRTLTVSKKLAHRALLAAATTLASSVDGGLLIAQSNIRHLYSSDADLTRFLKMRLDEFKKLPDADQTKFIQLYVNDLVKKLPKEKADAIRFDFGPVLTPGMAAFKGYMEGIQEQVDAGQVTLHALLPSKVVKAAVISLYPETGCPSDLNRQSQACIKR